MCGDWSAQLSHKFGVGAGAALAAGASRAFETLYGYPWKLRADSIEVIGAADPQ